MERKCEYCGSTTGCMADKGWPCTAERVESIERRHGYGTSSRDHRSFWD